MPQKSSSEKDTSNVQAKKDSPKKHRNPIVYAFSFVILVIIIVSFVVAPIYSPFGQNGQNIVFGKYDGVDISYKPENYFGSQYQMIKSQYQSTGSDLQSEYSALKAAFDRTVLQTAILIEASRYGIGASEAAVNREIVKSPRFLKENGSFDREAFRNANQLEVMNLMNLIRDDLKAQRIITTIMSASKLSSKEKAFLESHAAWQRSFSVVSFENSDFPRSEIEKFSKENSFLFKSRELSSISFKDKEAAEKAKVQLNDKTSNFEELARSASTDFYKEQGGKRGNVYYYNLKRDVSDETNLKAVYDLPKDGLSDVIESAGSFIIFKADSETKDPDFANAEVLSQLRAYLVENEYGVVQDYLSAEAKTFVESARTGSLLRAALALNKKVEETNSFPINYGGLNYPTMYGEFPMLPSPSLSSANNQTLSNAASREEFFISAFKLKPSEISEPILLQDRVLVLSLKDEKTSAESESMFSSYLEAISQYFLNNELNPSFVKEEKLRDNFDTVFFQNFAPRS